MAHTVENALDNDALERSNPTDDGYSFWLKGIPTEIKVVLSVNGARGGFNFETSHVIKTPLQISAYRPSNPWGDYEGYALYRAVTSITDHYKDALRSGLAPDPQWLVPY